MFSRLIQNISASPSVADELEKGRALLNAAVPGGAFAVGTRLALGLEVIQSALGDLPELSRREIADLVIDALVDGLFLEAEPETITAQFAELQARFEGVPPPA